MQQQKKDTKKLKESKSSRLEIIMISFAVDSV
jgi:hypothetical protein